MPNDNQIQQLVLAGRFNDTGDTFENVFHYRANTTANMPYADIETAMSTYFNTSANGNFVEAILLLSSANVRYDTMRFDNLDNVDDFTEIALTSVGNGAHSGDCLPQFTSWSFEYLRRTRATRNGRKAFAGVPESGVVNGVATVGLLTQLNALANNLEGGFNITVVGVGSITFEPVIVRKTGAFTYSAVNDVLSIQYKRVSTQNTRKR